jgi:hypothetical protein
MSQMLDSAIMGVAVLLQVSESLTEEFNKR